MNTTERDALAGKWILKAMKHEIAAREIDDDQDEEVALHREIAATLYQCAQDLQHPEPPQTARVFVEAQCGLNDIFPGDPYPPAVTVRKSEL
jgi:hypothetical protein